MKRPAPRIDLFDVRPDDERAFVFAQDVRVIEALLFATPGPVTQAMMKPHLSKGADVEALMAALVQDYAPRGVNVLRIAGGWMLRTAPDLAPVLADQIPEQRKLSRAAVEVLAIIAYHQPVTRAEIEEIRGVSTSRGTLDVLLETGWIRMRGRRRTPGRPVTYGTTGDFLVHFGLDSIQDLPGLDELKGAGLLDGRIPPGFSIPSPSDDLEPLEDEEPLDAEPLDFMLVSPPSDDETGP
ncbi:SMC-Scp complex subunit ScpB [Xanthobacter sp. TB0136]|uniref:SMC-Scp complex subunit ScpB n=1 Tax=Xanthobacter sp. TB0136 TaxID=3459177 RepID=UPI00403A6E46